MHNWGDDTVDWKGINESAQYIGKNLRKWGRVSVRDWKEKFGTVRVYCSLGWYQFHSITHPGHCFSRYPKWLWRLDCKYGIKIVRLLFNWFIIPYQKWLYRKLYADMVYKFPHLEKEILCMADYPELLKGLDK